MVPRQEISKQGLSDGNGRMTMELTTPIQFQIRSTHSYAVLGYFFAQHWAQSIQKNNKCKHPPSCTTTGRDVTLKWGDDKYIKTIPLGTKDNMATMYSSPDFDRFQTFCSQAEISIDDKENIRLCEECTSVLEDKDHETIHAQPVRLDDHDPKHDKHFQSDLPVDDETVSQIQLQQRLDNQSLDLLNLHTKCGHIPFARLR